VLFRAGPKATLLLVPGPLLFVGFEVRDDDRRREVAASRAVEVERAPESAQDRVYGEVELRVRVRLVVTLRCGKKLPIAL